MKLYLNCASDYSIQDDTGKKYTPEEAKALVATGEMSDCNLAFRRLMQNDYNLNAVKKFYREHPR